MSESSGSPERIDEEEAPEKISRKRPLKEVDNEEEEDDDEFIGPQPVVGEDQGNVIVSEDGDQPQVTKVKRKRGLKIQNIFQNSKHNYSQFMKLVCIDKF